MPSLLLGSGRARKGGMSAAPSSHPESGSLLGKGMWLGWAAVLAVFFMFLPRFGPTGGNTTCGWLISTWTAETSYEHGWLVVGLMAWLGWRARPGLLAEELRPSALGLGLVGVGVLLFVGGWRLIQPRINVVALPFLVYGSVVYMAGWARARHLIFPLSMVAFVIPLPGIQQMTTGLQIMATKMAYHATKLFGMQTEIAGNRVYDPTGNWGNWEIDEGCSGIRSIVALTLVTYVYGMTAHRKWKERAVIFAACIPIAILANAVRVTSILVVARINVDFAKTTWHDYSGFMSFGAALFLLMVLSKVMRQGLKALRPKVTVTRVDGRGPGSAGAPGAAGTASVDLY